MAFGASVRERNGASYIKQREKKQTIPVTNHLKFYRLCALLQSRGLK